MWRAKLFQQDHDNFQGAIKVPPSRCDLVLSGEVHRGSVSFVIYPTKSGDGCDFFIDVKAEFIPSCLSIYGHWTNIINGKEAESGSLLLFRNPIKLVEPKETQLVITAEPRMPNLQAKAVVEGPLLTKFKKMSITPYVEYEVY